MKSLGRFIVSAAILIALLASSTVAGASDYPTRPITAVVPFAAGGPSDIVMRVVGQRLSTALGQPIVVDNRGGAGGRVGAEYGARAPANGYTVTLANSATHGILPVTVRALTYDPLKDFALIGMIGTYPLALICNPKIPARNVPEMVAYLRKNPGKLSYGSPGAGGMGHFAGEFFKARAQVEMLHVPYKGTGPVLQDVMAGVVDCLFDGTSKPHVESGKLRALAVTSGKRDPGYPGVPTLEEEGLKGLDMVTWVGLVAPAGTPASVLRRLTDALNVALKDPQVVEGLRLVGTTAVAATSPDDLRQRITHDVEMYARIAKDANIPVQ